MEGCHGGGRVRDRRDRNWTRGTHGNRDEVTSMRLTFNMADPLG